MNLLANHSPQLVRTKAELNYFVSEGWTWGFTVSHQKIENKQTARKILVSYYEEFNWLDFYDLASTNSIKSLKRHQYFQATLMIIGLFGGHPGFNCVNRSVLTFIILVIWQLALYFKVDGWRIEVESIKNIMWKVLFSLRECWSIFVCSHRPKTKELLELFLLLFTIWFISSLK